MRLTRQPDVDGMQAWIAFDGGREFRVLYDRYHPGRGYTLEWRWIEGEREFRPIETVHGTLGDAASVLLSHKRRLNRLAKPPLKKQLSIV